MRPIKFITVGLVGMLLAGIAYAQWDKQDPAQVDRKLGEFAGLLGGQGLGGYKWPKEFQKERFIS